jgi:SNF2 family DNA or RNA helicase
MAKFYPHHYQDDGIKWILGRHYAGLFLPPGLGKTVITLSTFAILKEYNDVDTLFVIAPKQVATLVWPDEVKKWDHTKHLTIGVLHGKDKDITIKKHYDIYVINPEGLNWLLTKHIHFFDKKTVMCVFDESTLFKNHTSLRFKAIKAVLPKFKRRLILTGTPAPNGMIQLWPQIYLLDMGKRLSKYITHFRTKYFYQPNSYNPYDFKLFPDAETEIYAAINDIVMHKSKDELNLPPILYNNIYIELPLSVKARYKAVKDDLESELDEKSPIFSVNAAAKASKLKQIANGNVYLEDRQVLHLHDEKVEAIKTLVEDLNGRPLLVVYEFLHDLAELQKAFPQAPKLIDKNTNLQQVSDKWNRGEIPVMFIQPKSASHGLNLQYGGCEDVVWFSLTFDLELYIQTNDRVYRQGIKKSVTIHHIIAKDTVDEHVLKILEGKESFQTFLLDYFKK